MERVEAAVAELVASLRAAQAAGMDFGTANGILGRAGISLQQIAPWWEPDQAES